MLDVSLSVCKPPSSMRDGKEFTVLFISLLVRQAINIACDIGLEVGFIGQLKEVAILLMLFIEGFVSQHRSLKQTFGRG
jgi:hypothetical protein